MITQLTLTIDDALLTSAKKYARSKGRNVSDIGNDYPDTLSAAGKKKESLFPKILKLQGAESLPADFDYNTERKKALAKKYSN